MPLTVQFSGSLTSLTAVWTKAPRRVTVHFAAIILRLEKPVASQPDHTPVALIAPVTSFYSDGPIRRIVCAVPELLNGPRCSTADAPPSLEFISPTTAEEPPVV